jgi:rod shape determining protein RodA
MSLNREHLGFFEKFGEISWGMVALLTLMAGVGVMSLYSAAGGHFEPWADKHLTRFALGMCGLIVVALIDIRFWLKMSYPIFAAVVLCLVYVDVSGHIGMGAQRWINLGFMQFQPSEAMKIAAIMALAAFFHGSAPDDLKNPLYLLLPLGLVALPVFLVVVQPDLGTAIKIILVSASMFFLAGVSYWWFVAGGVAVLAASPVIWYLMHDYQRERVLTFLDPSRDALGSGYHITQSMIALGSGGIAGKGYLQGTQSKLNFLPEKQTDFIFTLFTEEWGFIGAIALYLLFAAIIAWGFTMALRCQSQYGRLLCAGVIVNFSFYVFINTGMVMGLLPVVGVPLPMISHGGSVMWSVLFGFGLLMSAYVHRDVKFPRKGLDIL